MGKEGALGRPALRGRREEAGPVKDPRQEPGCVRAARTDRPQEEEAERLRGSGLRQALGIRGSSCEMGEQSLPALDGRGPR